MSPADDRRRINYEHERARMRAHPEWSEPCGDPTPEAVARSRRVMLTHGRTRKRWAQRVALILYVIAGLIFFVAWAIMLTLLIQLLTY